MTLCQINKPTTNDTARLSFANRLLEDLAPPPRANCNKGLVGCLVLDFAFLSFPNVLQFLGVFGHFLHALSLRGPFLAAIVRVVLMLCPNLQFLDLIDIFISESISFAVSTPVRFEKTLTIVRHVGFRDGHLDFLVLVVS
jgi:hypothetical protein